MWRADQGCDHRDGSMDGDDVLGEARCRELAASKNASHGMAMLQTKSGGRRPRFLLRKVADRDRHSGRLPGRAGESTGRPTGGREPGRQGRFDACTATALANRGCAWPASPLQSSRCCETETGQMAGHLLLQRIRHSPPSNVIARNLLSPRGSRHRGGRGRADRRLALSSSTSATPPMIPSTPFPPGLRLTAYKTDAFAAGQLSG